VKHLIEQYLSVYALKVNGTSAARAGDRLRAFARTLAKQGLSEGSAITREHLLAWRLPFTRRGLKPYTIQGYTAPVRGFLFWMYREGYLLVNPYPKEWDENRAHARIRRAPSEGRARAMLERISEKSLSPVRDRAILELAYSSGLRRGELHGLNLRDLRGDWLTVRGKGGHERMVPLGAAAKAWLVQYIATERTRKVKRFNPHEDALFLSYQGKRLGSQSYSYLVSRNREKGDDITLHSFRHACATHMLARGANIVVLQKLLGHRKLSTTQVYTHVETESLKKVLDKCHPRG
jgi:integrase/recombinase XerD